MRIMSNKGGGENPPSMGVTFPVTNFKHLVGTHNGPKGFVIYLSVNAQEITPCLFLLARQRSCSTINNTIM